MSVAIIYCGIIAKSRAATIPNCGSGYTTQFISNNDGTTTRICSQSAKKWEHIYDEKGLEILAQQFQLSGGEWIVKEVIYNVYSSDNSNPHTSYSYFCNGYTTGKMWGVYYHGPESGCTTEAFVQQTNSSGSNIYHEACTNSSTSSSCVYARTLFCTPACSSCSNGVCSACFGGYMLKNDTCVKTCGDGYLIGNGVCIANDDCKNGFHAENGACVANTIDNCNTEIDGVCTECSEGYLTNTANTCTKTEECKDGKFVDSEAGACKPIPGCLSFADGECVCDKYYYKKENGCVSFEEGCGSGWLEKNRECIEASEGCGDGYKDLGGYCNRIRYTPAEAAAVANDDNTNVVTITFKK